jgi:polycystin 2
VDQGLLSLKILDIGNSKQQNLFKFKIFKYISINKTLDQLGSTLRMAAKDIAYFLIIFFIVFFSYTSLGYLLFGEALADYKSFTTTL